MSLKPISPGLLCRYDPQQQRKGEGVERDGQPPAVIDPSTPSVARMYDYYLGGKDNFPADRAAAEKIIELVPSITRIARDNRDFLIRVVRVLAAAGVRQFIDIGAGLPTRQNVHEVALEAAPDSRIVYVDNDPCKPGCTHDPRSRVGLSDDFHAVSVGIIEVDPTPAEQMVDLARLLVIGSCPVVETL
ncbi:SAM-dependent methyltransferase [Nonomuraea sp. NPDC003727]